MLDNVLSKLNVSNEELGLFNKEKDNFYLTENLFIKKDELYKIKITLDTKSIGYLLNNITEKDLLYTLYQGRKIKYKNKTKAQMINLIENIL